MPTRGSEHVVNRITGAIQERGLDETRTTSREQNPEGLDRWLVKIYIYFFMISTNYYMEKTIGAHDALTWDRGDFEGIVRPYEADDPSQYIRCQNLESIFAMYIHGSRELVLFPWDMDIDRRG
jgi:hypothetical protein